MTSAMPGMGVMINQLGGNRETVEAWQASKGKKITSLTLADDRLTFTLEDNSKFLLYDDGQSCCESRYMQTDDNLLDFVGGKLKDVEIREAPNQDGEYDTHEVQFLVIKTTKGNITVATHNLHNGYYGGFAIVARLEK
jgi:hypothetical protein